MIKTPILIVDDEPLNLQIAAECLAPFYHLFIAKNGAEALTILNHHDIALILLDIHMPIMDGFETAKKIQRLSTHIQTPIIYLTADTSEETISQAFDSGAADYIVKPFKQKELLARVKNRIETEQLKKQQRQLLEHNEHLIQLIKSHIAYIKTDKIGIITETSRSFCDLFCCEKYVGDLSNSPYIGKNVNTLKSGNTPRETYARLWETLNRCEVFTHDIENKNMCGECHWYRVTIAPDVNDISEVTGYICFFHNIDDQVRYAHNASVDYLTGLFNRSKFDDKLAEEMLRAELYHELFSIILVDIDHFKAVNDQYGHDVGDAVLKEVTHLLSKQIRLTDTLARWGGEEFIILCPNTDISAAVTLAEVLRTAIEHHHFDTVEHKTASFGVTQYHSRLDPITLFKHVDHALYQAKETGRNKVIAF
jgi:diguanylate cyclase (GGDEF)-like protein